MDRNDLLTATRIEFLRAFAKSFSELLPQSIDRLFTRADQARSSREQRSLLDARAVLQTRGEEVLRVANQSMEQLLNRSFRTAYSTFRPQFQATSGGLASLSLVDTSSFEGELKVDDITLRYRNAADEQLRDLNIRMAILFEQDDIKERENPFRPYLFSRCVINSVEALALSQELADALIGQFRDDLTEHVVAIYTRLNALLADHGIAAQLRLQVARNPNYTHSQVPQEGLSAEIRADDEAYLQQVGFGLPAEPAHASPTLPRGGSAPAAAMLNGMPDRAEQLLSWVRQSSSGGGFAPMPSSDGGWADGGGLDDGWSAEAALAAPTTAKPGGGVQGRRGWLSGMQAVGSSLREFFSPASPARPTPANSPLASAVQGLQQNSPAASELQAADGSLRNLILEMRPGLGGMVSDVSEEMTIDIVAMLFEFILRDNQVPAEVRAQLGRLQFLVLKVALQDPTLLTQRHHPARMLVNRIGSISLGLQQAGAHSERVIKEIQQIIERLLAEESPQLFATMLDEFDAFIARELRAADEQVERAVRVLESAESHTLRFARTSAGLGDALAGLTLDPYLHDFLLNGWAQAIERADRQDSAAATRYRQMVPDLIWSIAPKSSKEERSQLLAQIPLLLGSLRQGLALTGWSADQQQELLAWLIDAHTHALRASAQSFAVPSLADMRARFQSFVGGQDSEPISMPKRPALDRRMLDEAINEIEAELNLIERVLATEDSPAIEEPALFVEDEVEGASLEYAAAASGDVLDRLRSGVAIEINLNGKPSRAHLNWISPTASSLVLSIDGDDKPSALSVRLFLRLLENGRAHFLEAAPLFERAVQSLLQSADRMDRLDPHAAARLGAGA